MNKNIDYANQIIEIQNQKIQLKLRDQDSLTSISIINGGCQKINYKNNKEKCTVLKCTTRNKSIITPNRGKKLN